MTNKYHFVAGEHGLWKISRILPVSGQSLPTASRLHIVNGEIERPPADVKWILRGLTSNVRYATAAEITELKSRQPALNRPEATRAALIPIKKSAAWWDLAQDQRRRIFEETSHHNAIGLDYLPAIARRLHHSRDIGEPFDFLTWFEFAPEHETDFDKLLARLRATSEWTYVEREVDIRLERV
jgi:hypothetical protein